jgi:hypothetical protein
MKTITNTKLALICNPIGLAKVWGLQGVITGNIVMPPMGEAFHKAIDVVCKSYFSNKLNAK